jgi:hypothetical protein
MSALRSARAAFYRLDGPWHRRRLFEAVGSRRYSYPPLRDIDRDCWRRRRSGATTPRRERSTASSALVVFSDIGRTFRRWTEWAPELARADRQQGVINRSDRVEPVPYAGKIGVRQSSME